jgi:hypothetical protein
MKSEIAGKAKKATDNPVVSRLAKVGFVAKGLLYVLMGVVALRIAFGNTDEQADKSGALHLMSGQPLGMVLLWIMAIGLAALAIWQAGTAIFDHGKWTDRAGAAGRAVVYGVAVASILGLVLLGRNASSSDSQSKDASATLFELPGGPVLVGIAAAVLLILGGVWIYQCWNQKFMEGMLVGNLKLRAVVAKVGSAGFLARGVIAILAGILIGKAAIEYDPKEAVGIDGALRSLAQAPFGPWLLAIVALGLLLFALFCAAQARWQRT